MAAQIEVMLSERFNILASITWTKPNEPGYDGWKQKAKKESLRSWYLHSERIIFAESASAENIKQSAFGSLLRRTREAIGISTIKLTEAIGEYGSVNHGGIEASSYSGDLVLDCFAGSGVVGQAAKMLGRRAMLIEIEESLCHKITLRCSDISQPLPKSKTSEFDWKKELLFQNLLNNVSSEK